MKETDITQDSQNDQPYIQRNFIRYGRKPILQKHAESMEITTIITSTNNTVHLDAMREERYL